ncbi:hypothetical protein [Variovorax sp. PAMC26660]|uniref:hypothetical protein n=1 Tax=Variovorax sp. PAMC26660 TaxID=2762322 RepID=UPI00164D599B|nr:hypothetical protein [Variovorax sp. PAMC26660]QNK65830.1 hypothetical protein H7F35_21780 [Variovorax sp. PAMC26660]
MRRLFMIAMAVAITGCTGQGEAESGVKLLLNDPGSATFTEVQPGAAKGNFCGLVNAKNRMGGYVGNTPFFYEKSSTTSAIVQPPRTEDFQMYWLSIRSKSSSVEELMQLHQKCDLVARWKSVCGGEYPGSRHALCEALSGPGDKFYLAMKKEFGD